MKLLIITSLYSVYYMYMYCSYFIIQCGLGFMHQAAYCNKVSTLKMILKHGGDVNLQNGVSDYILIVIHM